VGKLRRVIVLPDPHIPVHDTRSIGAVEDMMSDHRFDGWICLGDLLDFNCISSHNINNLRAVEGQRIQADYKVAAEFLDRQAAILRKNNKNCRIILLEGNHDFRIIRYIDAHPQLEGLIEVPLALRLKGRGIAWVPYWSEGEVYKVGKATFIHGRYCNDHHAKKHLQGYGTSIFYGHTHDVQAYSLPRHGPETPIAQSLGRLCLPQQYMQGRPDRWQQAVAIFEFMPNGEFQYQVLRINDHTFSYNGKVYRG
jgi:predicted phosphodiesterase